MARFIIKTSNIANVTGISNSVHLFGEFYAVDAADIAALSAQVESCESVDAVIELQTVMASTNLVEGLPFGANWPRLRAISISHPLIDNFSKLEHTVISTPELYILDSGINFTHSEFAGITCNNFYKIPSFASFADEAGHGTAVAAAAVGVNLGMTNNVVLNSVKIFDEAGMPTLIQLADAFNAIAAHHAATPSVPKVVNCSWGIAKSAFLESTIQSLINSGVTVIAAAGNSGIDVATITPASMVDVLTVGAIDKDDVVAGFNNFATIDMPVTSNSGLTIDMFAPGVDVIVAFGTANMYCTTSGSSISAGVVAGAAVDALSISSAPTKELLMKIASKGMLLLDYNKFTTLQNNLVYLLTSPDVRESKVFFVGTTSNVAAISSKLSNFSNYKSLADATGQMPQNSFVAGFDDVSSIVTFTDDADGHFVITNPSNITWANNEAFRLFSFKVHSYFGAVTADSCTLMFAVPNPSVTTDYSADLNTALENVNAVSEIQLFPIVLK